MQNEFEKQVQKKLEELRLVPTDPVWEKVAMQIRPKKSRRRIIFWLVFAALVFTGGGVWFYYKSDVVSTAHQRVSRNVPPSESENNSSTEQIMKGNPANARKEGASRMKEHSVEGRKNNKWKPATIKSKSHVALNQVVTGKKLVQKRTAQTAGEALTQTKQNSPAEATATNDFETIRADSGQMVIKNVAKEQNFKEALKDSSAGNTDTVAQQKELADTIQQTKSAVKRYAKKTWRFGVQANAGFSGLTTLDVFKGFATADAFSNYNGSPSGGPGAVYRGPSPVKSRPAFSLGAAVQKQLSERLMLETGLVYNFYSNSMAVGNAIARDTTFNYRYAVSRFYTNGGSMNEFTNRYHFLALPVSLAWQMHKFAPLSLEAGLSLQRLFASNALVFNYPSQAYYHNKDAFKKTQLFSEVGIRYSWRMKKAALAFGPSLRYGLTPLAKDDGGNHLFSMGVSAKLLFNKK